MRSSAVAMAGVAALLLTTAGIHPLTRLALRFDLTDRPGGYKAHGRPVPYIGGVAILAGTAVPATVFLGLADDQVGILLIGAAVVAMLGLVDDIVALTPATRLCVEALVASGVVLSGVQIPLTGGWPDGLVTVLWMVVITNSFNLLDNMDGALGATVVVGAGLLAAGAFVHGSPSTGLLLVTLAFAALGFLPHNWAPAKVFMGDSGSLFIGFVIAGSAASLATHQATEAVVANLLLPTFVATVDTGVVLLSRLWTGRPLMRGGTDHLSHRLHRLGMGTRRTALVLAAVTAAAGGLHLAMALGLASPLIATIGALGAAILLIGLPQRVSVSSPRLSHTPSMNISERQ
ncbi:MraY family glycosyltransferase [Sphaerisporangium corydalis]|uniref:MraY family glycosyltransferase n=1 Tax=Sphaerisporangium corydalis TaxID=1441875 RepID=A0ABV9EN95_9ACTN|nr:MraY family glycosyltransferase [Sphaerisporangium corydalis]